MLCVSAFCGFSPRACIEPTFECPLRRSVPGRSGAETHGIFYQRVTSMQHLEDLHPPFTGYLHAKWISSDGTLHLLLSQHYQQRYFLHSYHNKTFKNEEVTLKSGGTIYGFDKDGNLYYRELGNRIAIQRRNGECEIYDQHPSFKNVDIWAVYHGHTIMKGNDLLFIDKKTKNLCTLVFDSSQKQYNYKILKEHVTKGNNWVIDENFENLYTQNTKHVLKFNLTKRTTSFIAVAGDSFGVDNEGIFQLPLRRVHDMIYHRQCLFLSVDDLSPKCSVWRLDLVRNTLTAIMQTSPDKTTIKYAPELAAFGNSLYLIIFKSTADSCRLYRFNLGELWENRRLLWIGKMKEEAEHCLLACLPKELIREIDNYLC